MTHWLFVGFGIALAIAVVVYLVIEEWREHRRPPPPRPSTTTFCTSHHPGFPPGGPYRLIIDYGKPNQEELVVESLGDGWFRVIGEDE